MISFFYYVLTCKDNTVVSFGRPCHVPPCLINEEVGSNDFFSGLDSSEQATREPKTSQYSPKIGLRDSL